MASLGLRVTSPFQSSSCEYLDLQMSGLSFLQVKHLLIFSKVQERKLADDPFRLCFLSVLHQLRCLMMACILANVQRPGQISEARG